MLVTTLEYFGEYKAHFILCEWFPGGAVHNRRESSVVQFYEIAAQGYE